MSRAGEFSPRYKWKLVVFLCVVAMVNYADRTAISAVFPLLGSELGMSDVALAALGSFFLWSYAACSPFAGVLADRFSRSRLVVLSLTAWSLVTIWTGFAHSATELLVTRVMLGVTECAYLPAALALMADHHDTDTRATALGLHLAGLNFGLIAGGTLAGQCGHLGAQVLHAVLARQRRQELIERRDLAVAQSRGWLIQQQELRFAHQRTAHRKHLPFAAGHGAGKLRQPLLEPREQRKYLFHRVRQRGT